MKKFLLCMYVFNAILNVQNEFSKMFNKTSIKLPFTVSIYIFKDGSFRQFCSDTQKRFHCGFIVFFLGVEHKSGLSICLSLSVRFTNPGATANIYSYSEL